MDRLTANIAEAGGRILTETAIREFHQDAAGRIIGAEARGPNGRLRISRQSHRHGHRRLPGQPRTPRPLLRPPQRPHDPARQPLQHRRGLPGRPGRWRGHRGTLWPLLRSPGRRAAGCSRLPLIPARPPGRSLAWCDPREPPRRTLRRRVRERRSQRPRPPAPTRRARLHDLQRIRRRHGDRLGGARYRQVRRHRNPRGTLT